MKKAVVIVDDHLLIAKAIASIISEFNDFEVLYEVENGKRLMEKFSQSNENIPAIVLLDVSMPEMNGFETAAWLSENHPEILILALSVQDDEDTLLGMIKKGAKGYLHKNVHPDELETALKELIKTGVYFPSWASSKIAQSFVLPKSTPKPTILEPITSREEEFLRYVCLELTYKEISDKMFCSPRTVEGYRDSLCEKLGLHSRVGLALYAVKNGYFKI